MIDKPYTIDGKPADMYDIINAAKDIDPHLGEDGILTTSRCATVLRAHGHSVGHNKPPANA